MATYKDLFEEQRQLNERHQRKINDLESKQRQIQSSIRHLRTLKQELTSINKEAQFHNDKIHAFLSAFIPDYRLVNEPTDGTDYILENNENKKKNTNEKDLVDKHKTTTTSKNDERIPKVQIEFKYENDTSVKQEEKLPIPLVTYEWSDNAEKLANNYPTYLPRLGYSTYIGNSKLYSQIKPDEELKLTLKFETISTDLPTKLHLELCDDSGNIVFSKRQNIYYIKLQEKLATLDCDKDYVLKITSIQDDIKTDEEVVIQNKKACDGGTKVAKPIKANVKEILLKQATCEELPKLSIKEVTFAIEPIDAENSQNACISQLKNDHLVTAKRVKRPVVLWNKDSESVNIIQNNKPPPNNPKILKIEPRKVLPDVILYRWHSGFRHHQGRYTKVTVLKLELYYPDDLHDILVSRNLNLTLKSLTLTLHTQSRVLDHKCLAEFVIFENLSQNLCNFNLKMSVLFEAADLEEFDIDLMPFQPNVWLKHEFEKPKTTCNSTLNK